jgi:hypothetical protein
MGLDELQAIGCRGIPPFHKNAQGWGTREFLLGDRDNVRIITDKIPDRRRNVRGTLTHGCDRATIDSRHLGVT